MKNATSNLRLLWEIVATIVIVEIAVMYALSWTPAGIGETAKAVLDATLLSTLAGPVILWRMRRSASPVEQSNIEPALPKSTERIRPPESDLPYSRWKIAWSGQAAIVSYLFLAGLIVLVFAGWRLQAAMRGSADATQDSLIKQSLIDYGQQIARNIEHATKPAIQRGRKLAADPAIAQALANGNRSELTALCNRVIREATEIDAVALFDTQGKILAINTVYTDGTPIPLERIDRITSTSFAKRNIITACLNNTAHSEVLEYQTNCDITPALFDSSGLSVAHSVPVFNETGKQVGVVSTRLRFERITDLIESHPDNGEHLEVCFVTDGGKIFDESLNRNGKFPVPPDQLQKFTAPLVDGSTKQLLFVRENMLHALMRMTGLSTVSGGGIQVMISAPEYWVNKEIRAVSMLSVGAPTAIGVLLLLVGASVRSSAAARYQASLARMALAEAEAANRSKSAFLANMSHEIRTPLTAIMGYADILREEGNISLAPEHRVHSIDTIRNAANHLLTVINDILDLSKIEANKMAVEKIETPVTQALREIESLMRPRAKGKGVSLNVELATPLPERIASDPTRLRQILMNLVGNAIKFTEAGSIKIIAGEVDNAGQRRLVIDIQDTGPGMTLEQVDRLFQVFAQADNSVTRKFGGTGLGLMISRRLAGLMGGEVSLIHTEPGKGSCFRVDLPLEAIPGTPMVTRLEAVNVKLSNPMEAPTQTLRGRILLAEDGIDNQRLISFHLKKAGVTVDIAENGKLALEMLENASASGHAYDLLLTDIQMPEMDGYSLASLLRERNATLPIIALTAHAMAEDRDRCLRAGCDDFLTKPIDRSMLLATCFKWIGKTGGQSSAAKAA